MGKLVDECTLYSGVDIQFSFNTSSRLLSTVEKGYHKYIKTITFPTGGIDRASPKRSSSISTEILRPPMSADQQDPSVTVQITGEG